MHCNLFVSSASCYPFLLYFTEHAYATCNLYALCCSMDL